MALAFFSRPLRIALGAEGLHARSPAELEAKLAGRTTISPTRADVLGALSDPELQREADALRQQEQQIIQALAHDSGRPDGLDALFDELDLETVTGDQGWRTILEGLREAGPAGRRYRRVALGHYLAYVGAARDLMRALLAGRSGVRAGVDLGETMDISPRQSLVFDPAALLREPRSDRESGFERMPKGDAVEIELLPHQSLDLLLARHAFMLVAGPPHLLVDEHGNDVKLQAGKNVIGRSLQSDVGLDPVFRAVSRRHLVVEFGEDHIVRLTDISTLGTFLPRPYLDSRLH